MTSAKAWGIDARLLTPAEIKEMVPFINADILLGGYYTPSVSVVDSLQTGTLMRCRGDEGWAPPEPRLREDPWAEPQRPREESWTEQRLREQFDRAREEPDDRWRGREGWQSKQDDDRDRDRERDRDRDGSTGTVGPTSGHQKCAPETAGPASAPTTEDASYAWASAGPRSTPTRPAPSCASKTDGRQCAARPGSPARPGASKTTSGWTHPVATSPTGITTSGVTSGGRSPGRTGTSGGRTTSSPPTMSVTATVSVTMNGTAGTAEWVVARGWPGVGPGKMLPCASLSPEVWVVRVRVPF